MHSTSRRALSWIVAVGLAAPWAAVALGDEAVVGEWKGELSVQGTSLPIVFHVTESDGTLSATMDSPNQGAFGIPVDEIAFEDGKLSLTISSIPGVVKYEGTLDDSGDKLNGTFSQGGMQLPLNLERAAEDTRPRPVSGR